MLVEAGNSCVPLSLVGQFLTEAGQILKSSVDAFNSSRVLCDTAVREVRRVQLGEVGTSSTAAAGSVPSPARQLWRVAIERKQPATVLSPTSFITGKGIDRCDTEEDSPDALFAEVVVFANGGVQPITRALHPVHSKKALSSDFVCTKQGVAVLLDMLSKSKPPTGGSATNKDRKIVIIGGSHSAFSAAWICLNKLDPQKVLFSSGSICLVHRSPVLVFYGSKRDAEVDGYTDIKHINRNGQIHPFGGIRGDAKQLFRHVRNGKETRVRMLLLKGGSEAPAAAKLMDEAAVVIWSCGYQTNAIPVRDVDGEDIRLQYSFGQVEVDDNARVLQEPPPEPLAPLDICSVDAPARPAEATPLVSPMKTAAAALTTNTGTGSGATPKKPPLIKIVTSAPSTPNIKVNAVISGGVSRSCSLVKKPKPTPIKDLYATGLGYGLQATFDNGEPDGSSGRADGVAVYLKRSATLILSSVVGTKVYGDNATSWKERIEQGLVQAASAMKQKQQFPVSPVRPATTATTEARATAILAKQTAATPTRAPTQKSAPKPATGANRSPRGSTTEAATDIVRKKSVAEPTTLKNIKPVLGNKSSTASKKTGPSTSSSRKNSSGTAGSSSKSAAARIVNVAGATVLEAATIDVDRAAVNSTCTVSTEPSEKDLLLQLCRVTATESDRPIETRPVTAGLHSDTAGRSNYSTPPTEFPIIARPNTVNKQLSSEKNCMFNGNRLQAPRVSGTLYLPNPNKRYSSSSAKSAPAGNQKMVGIKYSPSCDQVKYKTPEAFDVIEKPRRVNPPFGVRSLISNAVVNPYYVVATSSRNNKRGLSNTRGTRVVPNGNPIVRQSCSAMARSPNSPMSPVAVTSPRNAAVAMSTMVLTSHGLVHTDTPAKPRTSPLKSCAGDPGLTLSPIRPSNTNSSQSIGGSIANNSECGRMVVTDQNALLSASLPTGRLHGITRAHKQGQ